jgi:glycosyltransferase involved in cell wall biosynthesis
VVPDGSLPDHLGLGKENQVKIAVFFHENIFCSWNMARGIPETLARMGHGVLENHWDDTCDLILVSGPEHDKNRVGKQQAGGKVPVAYLYHETTGRQDKDFAPIYEALSRDADYNFFVRQADAERFGGHQLSFGVDHVIFNAFGTEFTERKNKVAFCGQLYPIRQDFLNAYNAIPGHTEIAIHQFVGQGLPSREAAIALADFYRNTQIVVVLPIYTRATVTKVFEATACGCCVVTPWTPERAWEYDEGEVVHYSEDKPESLHRALKDLSVSRFAQLIADSGYRKTHTCHRLSQKLETILDIVEGP